MVKQWSLMCAKHFLNVAKSGDRFVKLKSFVIPMDLVCERPLRPAMSIPWLCPLKQPLRVSQGDVSGLFEI